ncbi:MAG: cation-translocating P-type ATPase, partial [Candidatus Eremiobacteraeota bacterium]|nr:cation-translocating P-type ATPase [Candidatus Eremiobacteraeota bacterium]
MSCSGPAFFIYFISGMWCTTCSKTVCSRVLKLAGVGGAEINFTTKLLTVEVDSAEPEALDGKIRMAVTQMGFGIKRQPDGWVQSFRQDLEQEHTRAISPGLFSIVAFLAMWSSMLSFSAYLGGLEQSEAYLLACLSTAMGTPAILIGCLPFVRAGLRALGGSRLITLDLFIGLGALSAVSLSLHNLAAGSSQTYVDSAAMILLVLLLAKILEARLSSYLAGQLLTQMEYGQDRVMVYSQDRWIQREAAAIRRRDRVRFEAGETVIFDGCLESPKALINSHLLNGEASDLPLERGAALFAGSIARSELELLVSQPLGSRMLDGWAESALLSKGRPHRYSGLLLTLERALTLVALAGASCLAASQWVQSGDLRLAAEAFAIGILIFCPCLFASILPLSKQMAHLALSRRGIIISRSEALLDLSGVDQIYLDKTGTLEAVDSFFRSSCASTETRARQLLASLARFSQHPVLLGLADLRAGLAPASVELEVVTTPGQGVRAEDPMGGDVLCVGRPAFVYRQVGLNPPAVQSHYPQ